MRFAQFRSSLKDFPVFATEDIRAVDPAFDRRRLSEWQAKGYIRKIAKGLYFFSDAEVDEGTLFRIANKLYGPSYVSLETALAHQQLVPEAAYGITSVTTRRTYRFETPLAGFTYRTVARRLFFGYVVSPDRTRIATLEKALLDYLYLNPHIDGPVAFASLRIDSQALLARLDEKLLRDQLHLRVVARALDHPEHRGRLALADAVALTQLPVHHHAHAGAPQRLRRR